MVCALFSCFPTAILKPSPKMVTFRIRAHLINPRDNERPRARQDSVDANMSVLREKIEQVKMKEGLGRCLKHQNGWNYEAGYGYGYNYKTKKRELVEVAILVGGAFGSSFVFGTLFLCFLSLLLHLNQFLIQY